MMTPVFDLTPYGVGKDTEILLSKELLPFTESLEMWKKQAASITVSDASQTDMMKHARELRLTIRPKRTAVEEVRKRLKADSLAYGRAVDGVAKTIMEEMQKIESDLQQKEDFKKIEEEKIEKSLETSRMAVLAEYGEYSFLTDLGKWTQDRFEAYLEDQKAILAVRLKKEKEEREEAELKAKEAEILRAENERIQREAKAQADAMAEELRKARAEHDRLLLEKTKAEAQARLKAQEEERRIAGEEAVRKAAERKAASAPDKDKLIALSKTLSELDLPVMSSEPGKQIMGNISNLRGKLVAYIQEKIISL